MKKYLPVCMLYARSTVYKLFGLLGAMVLSESALFYMAIRQDYVPEQVFSNSYIPIAALVIYLLWTVVLCCLPFSQAKYTMSRLPVARKEAFFCHAVYNGLSYVILWAVQLLLILVLFLVCGSQADPALNGPQSILFAFYDVPFLHALLPMLDWTIYLRNFAMIFALGILTASVSIRLQNGKNIIGHGLLALILAPAVFRVELGLFSETVLVTVISLAAAFVIYINTFVTEEEYDET